MYRRVAKVFWILLLFQLDANLIEGEPYNRLAQKNKRRQIYRKYGKPVFKARQNSVGPGPVSSTHRFFSRWFLAPKEVKI